MTDILNNIKLDLLFALAGVGIMTAVGLIIPSGMFLPAVFIPTVLFLRIYLRGGKNFFILDVSYTVLILISIGITSLMLRGGCVVLTTAPACASNELKATLFLVLFLPIAIAIVLWLFFRFPKTIKSIFKNEG